MSKWPWRKKWYCSNVGNKCTKADTNEEIPIVGDLIEPVCEECGSALFLVQKKFPLLPSVGIVVLVLAAACYLLWPTTPWVIKLSAVPPGNVKLYSGDSATWNVEITGGKSSAKPKLSAQSLSVPLIPTNGLQVDSTDDKNRKYKLTARSLVGQTGRAEIKIFASIDGVVKVTTNISFEMRKLDPPVLILQTPVPSVLKADSNSVVLLFQVSDAKTDAARLSFLATAEPSERMTVNIQSTGAVRTVILSRNQWESGPVKLAVRLVTPDGRETNQTYSVTVVPLPSPAVTIAFNSTSPPGGTVHPGEGMTWEFTVGGGAPSEKPTVSVESLSPSVLPQAALKLEALDETKRTYKLTARPAAAQGGSVEIRISARLAGTIQNTTLSFTVAASTVTVPMVTPPVAVVRELLKKARAAWIERRYQEAIGYCDDAIALDPQSVEAWTIKGGVNYSWLRYPDAIAACDAAIAINPKFADAWFTKASSEEKSGNLQAALGSYHKFLETVQAPDARVPVVEDRIRKLEGH
jgi:hypothetical protein